MFQALLRYTNKIPPNIHRKIRYNTEKASKARACLTPVPVKVHVRHGFQYMFFFRVFLSLVVCGVHSSNSIVVMYVTCEEEACVGFIDSAGVGARTRENTVYHSISLPPSKTVHFLCYFHCRVLSLTFHWKHMPEAPHTPLLA
jgi:hypothetical protein